MFVSYTCSPMHPGAGGRNPGASAVPAPPGAGKAPDPQTLTPDPLPPGLTTSRIARTKEQYAKPSGNALRACNDYQEGALKPHDELFRTMVADREAQQDLLRIALPDVSPRMDLSTLATVDATFTGGKQADLLLSVQGSDGSTHLVFMLMEHKSYGDPLVAIQLYRCRCVSARRRSSLP